MLDKELIDNEHAFYFPAYEIMRDELRDYRFYADVWCIRLNWP